MLTASMKGLVALSGLEAMSNGIQFVKNEDAGIVRWGKRRLPRLRNYGSFTVASRVLEDLSRLLSYSTAASPPCCWQSLRSVSMSLMEH